MQVDFGCRNLVKTGLTAYNDKRERGNIMQSMALKINHLLEDLEEEDYDKAVSYIEFLISVRKEKEKQMLIKSKEDVASIVKSLTGIIPDTGKTLEEYREERLKKYEISD